MTDTDFVQEVAAPGAVFWEAVTHPANVEILEGDERLRRLPKPKLKEMQKRAEVLQAGLNVYLGAFIEYLEAKRAQLIEQPRAVERIDEQIAAARDRMKKIPKQRGARLPIRTADEARTALTALHRLEARIEEHYRALENDEINRRLQDEMMLEISFYASQIVDRWTALGYREEFYIDGKRNLRRVRFEEAHFTEDNIQFKIYVSHLTLLGSTMPELPDRVRAWDLVKPETLRELEAACECPVTSPHVEGSEDESQGFEKGAWVVVHRVGMRDGLFNYVELAKVLPKYNQALRKHYAAPVGIKSGRQIEYLYLDQTPHIMFNGITGSGKTNVARVFLATWCQFYSPDEIRFVLVDLKRSGDLNHFARIPHLVTDIVKEIDALEQLAPRLIALMHQRMSRLSALNCTDIAQYNSKVSEADQMPRVVVLIDECGSISDLAFSEGQKDQIWRCLALLSAQARAAGIHLMLGTQQPAKEAIPTRVTNNITFTLSGRQRTVSGAMTAHGNNRTRQLPAIQGRMLVDNGFGLFPVQTPFATEADQLAAVAIAKDYPTPRPFELPGDDEAGAALEAEAVRALGVTREQVIALALDSDGVLSAQRIYEQTAGVTPRATIAELIRALADEEMIHFEGADYLVKPYGKGWQIVEQQRRKTEKPKNGVANVGVSHGFTPVLQLGTELEMSK